MAKGFKSLKPQVGREKKRLDEIVEIEPYPNKKWFKVRFLPTDILAIKTHWITIVAGKDKREIKIPKLCVSFDPDTEEVDPNIDCPYCKLSGQDNVRPTYYANAIIRDIQDDKPRRIVEPTRDERKTGLKSIDSRSWTPVRVIKITPTLAQRIQGLTELNQVKIKGRNVEKEVSDPRYGMDVLIKFDKDEKGSAMYTVNSGERTSLTEEERNYLTWDLSKENIYTQMGVETEEQAQKEVSRMEIVVEDDDMEEKSSKKFSKSSVYLDDEDDEDDEDDKPVSRRRRKTRNETKTQTKKKTSLSSDESPRRKRRTASSDDDEPPRRKRRTASSDDDEPPRRKRKTSSTNKKQLKSKPNSDVDELDDDDIPF